MGPLSLQIDSMTHTMIGYARCSTDKQDLAAQKGILAEMGIAADRIYTDHGFTGSNRLRPGLDQALAAVRAGDTFVVPKLDRLARSVPDARAIADALAARGVKLQLGSSVHDPTDPMGKMFFNILATFAEFEADLIRMRTREGMAVARAKGKLRGKKPKLSDRQQRELRRMYVTYEVLTNGLLPDTLQGLDDLLARRPGQVATWLSWMRNAPQSPAARNILRLIERLAYIRALGLDRARADMIPALTFDRLADEGSRITPQHLGELNALRRHATLAATGIRLEESLTDATLTMFDKLLGSMARRAENRTRDKALKTVRELQGHLRTLTGSCRLLIDARSKGVDSLAQIEALDWQHFAVAVEQAEVLGRPETVDRTAELIERHRTVKLFVGAFLNAFEFRGAGAVQGLLSALAIIAELYRTGKRRLPDRVPLRFVPPAWRPFVLRDGIVDRAAYELCALSQLRERLRAGDIWVYMKRSVRERGSSVSPPIRFPAKSPVSCAHETTRRSIAPGQLDFASGAVGIPPMPYIALTVGPHGSHGTICLISSCAARQ